MGSPPMWPDDAVLAVAALEKASHESFSSDYQKYNQKMRQLCFNLKEGLTAEELASKEPEEDAQVQMTDARCKRCTEKKVLLIEIISAGHADRYQAGMGSPPMWPDDAVLAVAALEG